MKNATERLADFICRFEPGSLPDDAACASKVAILDCLGVALAASREPAIRILRDYALETASREEAVLWGTRHKVAALDAALVNGAMAHVLDYDDLNRFIQGHPSAVLVPAIFAAGEKRQCSGRQALEAYVVGFEVMTKLGQVLNPGLYEKGWHPTSVLGIMGACASAGYLLRLNVEQTIHALGLAASEASGIKKNFGSMAKSFHAGSAARKGLWAALLAQRGLTANPNALEGNYGFLELFSGDLPYNLEPLGNLGRPLEIMASGIVIKQYPCCGSTHPALDGIFALTRKEKLNPAQIEDIECRLNPRRIGHINRPEVHDGLEAKFSLQYCAAVALADGKISLAHFSSSHHLTRPEVRKLMQQVRILPTESLNEFAAQVVLRTSAGREYSHTISETRGSPSFPLTEAELLAKFVDCVTTVVSSQKGAQAGKAIMNLEGECNLDRVLELISPDSQFA